MHVAFTAFPDLRGGLRFEALDCFRLGEMRILELIEELVKEMLEPRRRRRRRLPLLEDAADLHRLQTIILHNPCDDHPEALPNRIAGEAHPRHRGMGAKPLLDHAASLLADVAVG